MLKKKYLGLIKKILKKHLKKDKDMRAFIYGSSIVKEKFNDVDIGLIGKDVTQSIQGRIMEDFEESLLPYECDVIDFNKVDKKFIKKVLNNKILWLT